MGSSLLSGYGGPGQGSQALLGSAMLNGSGGGSGSAGASGSSTSSTVAAAAAPSGTGQPAAASTRPRSHRHAHGAAGASSQASAAKGQTLGPTRISDVYAAAERGGSAPSAALLGLSGTDFLLIVLVLCALGFMGVLTRRLTRASRREGSVS
jgi:hypothetical protein